jgi:hypothetical protein
MRDDWKGRFDFLREYPKWSTSSERKAFPLPTENRFWAGLRQEWSSVRLDSDIKCWI